MVSGEIFPAHNIKLPTAETPSLPAPPPAPLCSLNRAGFLWAAAQQGSFPPPLQGNYSKFVNCFIKRLDANNKERLEKAAQKSAPVHTPYRGASRDAAFFGVG